MRLIVSRAPLRLPLGGGGTDLESFYKQFSGFWTAATIDRYVRMTVAIRWEETYVVKHGTSTDRVSRISEITHPIIKACLEFIDIEQCLRDRDRRQIGLEINIISDVPSKSGLGVSGAICVSFLHALHILKGDVTVDKTQLAEEAYHVEHDLAGFPNVGKQDHYAAAFGGIASYEATRKGTVDVLPLDLSNHVVSELLDNLLIFGTGIVRDGTADATLQVQTQALQNKKSDNAAYLQGIKQIGLEQRDALEDEDVHHFGELFHTHWETKKQYSRHGEQPEIDEVYSAARAAGALGGKVVGAGTKGAFWLFYCEEEKAQLRALMERSGKKELLWQFSFDGSVITHCE